MTLPTLEYEYQIYCVNGLISQEVWELYSRQYSDENFQTFVSAPVPTTSKDS